MLREQLPVTVVIQEYSVQYLRPVAEDMQATCTMSNVEVLKKFLCQLARNSRARLELEEFIHVDGEVALRFRGQFVAYDRARVPGFEPG